MPMVSVIIPSYNHGHFVSEAIESVHAQTYPNYEIIVVDDGSTDGTSEVVAHYPDVRYVRQQNQGLSSARNRGTQESRGEYIVFLDADDCLLPQHFEISLEAFRSHPEVGWVCGNRRFLGASEPLFHCCPLPDPFGVLLRLCCIGAPHTVMYRRNVLVKIGGFNKRVPQGCEDWELYLRLSRQATLYCHHQLIAEYRVSDQQMSRQWHVMLKSAVHVIRSQWPFVRGNLAYEKAYYEGLARARGEYGERALWQMVIDTRSGQWTRALKALWVLLRCYPIGLVNLFRLKARKSFVIRKQGSS